MRLVGLVAAGFAALVMAACGGGGGGGGGPSGPAAPADLRVAYGAKIYNFSWAASPGATRYELLEDPDGAGPLAAQPVGGAITATTYSHRLDGQLLTAWINASYRVRACDATGCGPAGDALVPDPAKAVGQLLARNAAAGDFFGQAVALSADGGTLAVGAPKQKGGIGGIDPDEADRSRSDAGAVYVFARAADGGWVQQAFIKSDNPTVGAQFGQSIALSGDGQTLAVGDQPARAVRVYRRSGSRWSQQAAVTATSLAADSGFGSGLALSSDGRVLAVTAPFDASNATGVDGDPTDRSLPSSGAAYVFASDGTQWRQQAYLKASVARGNWRFGSSIALSGGGDTVAVGAWWDDSTATGVNGDPAASGLAAAGGVTVFARRDGAWRQQAYIKPLDTAANARFGYAVALSGSGDTLAAGTSGPDSVYVFERAAGAAWSQRVVLKPAVRPPVSFFGTALSLSSDGGTVAVGALGDSSRATGFDGDARDTSAPESGAAYVFTREGAGWAQRGYIKPNTPAPLIMFGTAVALSGDGRSLAIGAPLPSGRRVSLSGIEVDNSLPTGGTVSLY